MSPLLRDLPQPISPEAEQTLLALDHRDEIVLAALRPAFSYMKRLSRGRLPDDEILSAVYAALSKAIKNFKPGQQRFISYARAYCRGEIASIWRDRDVVKSSSKHETDIPKDAIPQPLEPDSVGADFEGIHWKEQWAQVEPVIRETLTPTEIKVLEGRYKFSLTLAETGKHIGKSRERVRQIEADALRKLRAALSSRGELCLLKKFARVASN